MDWDQTGCVRDVCVCRLCVAAGEKQRMISTSMIMFLWQKMENKPMEKLKEKMRMK